MWPELFTIPFLDFPLRAFGLLVATGFLVGVSVGSKLAARHGSDLKNDPEKFADVSWWVLIGVILGARIAFVIVNAEHYIDHPGDILKIWEGGLVMYGGLIGAITMGAIKSNRLGMPKWQTLDYGITAGFLDSDALLSATTSVHPPIYHGQFLSPTPFRPAQHSLPNSQRYLYTRLSYTCRPKRYRYSSLASGYLTTKSFTAKSARFC